MVKISVDDDKKKYTIKYIYTINNKNNPVVKIMQMWCEYLKLNSLTKSKSKKRLENKTRIEIKKKLKQTR